MCRFMEEVAATSASPLTAEDAHVQVHHYLATSAAQHKVTDLLARYGSAQPKMTFLPSFSYVLPADVVVSPECKHDLSSILEAHYDPGIETSHTGPDIALGYKKGGLPLVLAHNTPNNSLATLWARSDSSSPRYMQDKHMWPLFPRRQRHSDARP